MALNKNILLYDEPRKLNTKASEEYVHVKFFTRMFIKNGMDGFPLNTEELAFQFLLTSQKNLMCI